MKFLKQFAIIIVISFCGELLNAIVPFPIPSSIYGLFIMFFLLKTKLLALDSVRETGKFLIEIMPLMFIPAAVGLVDSWNVLKPMCLVIGMITVISTILVMGVTGRVTQSVIRLQKRKEVMEGVEE